MIRRAGLALLGLAAAVGLLLPAAPALADERRDGLWYFDDFNVQAAHDAGLTGAGVTIGLIDAGIDASVTTLQGADVSVAPETLCGELLDDPAAGDPLHPDPAVAAHGTAVASMIVGNGSGITGDPGTRGVAPDAAIRFYALDNRPIEQACGGGELGPAVAAGIEHLVDDGVDLISVSMVVGPGPELEDALVDAFAARIPVLVGLPNADDLVSGWSEMNSIVGVQSVRRDLSLEGTKPSADVDVVAPGFDLLRPDHDDTGWFDGIGGGTSFATPITAGFLAVLQQKYPEATGWQLLQSLVRNTGLDDHEPYWSDGYGYGLVSLTHLLRNDPTVYPDEHPLLAEAGADAAPSTERLLGGSGRAEEAVDAAAPADDAAVTAPGDTGGSGSILTTILIVAAALGVLVLAGIVITIVIVVRRSRPAAGH